MSSTYHLRHILPALLLLSFCHNAWSSSIEPSAATTASDQCLSLVAIRLGRMMDLHQTQVRSLNGNRYLVEGEARQSQPPVGFACVMLKGEKTWQLEKLELYQLKGQTQLNLPN